jgi:L-cysteate sulfo-lyase
VSLPDFPKFRIAHLPTPLEPLHRMRKHLNGPRLYIKRDDCTGLALGGNKTRKLEFLIGDAIRKGATTVVTEGGLQSNHVRQTAAAAAKAGLQCHLVLDHQVPINTPLYAGNGNILLDRLLGAKTHLCASGETRADAVERLTAELRARGAAPYVIPTGGSNEIGALGYVSAALELLQQARDSGLSIDRVVFPTGSGGTQAGLIVGLALAMAEVSATGIDIDGDADALAAHIDEVVAHCTTSVGLAGGSGLRPPDIVRGFAGPGYGIPTPGMIEAVNLAATLEGIVLDPVYTGKAMAGLIDMIRSGEFAADETIVFIHTGGAPGLFAYADSF